jgi:hypothetical protein
VAIELGLREGQVNKFFREFWRLKNLNGLYEIYPQIEQYLPSFLKLHKVLKKKGLNPQNTVICRPYRIGYCKTSRTPRSIPKTQNAESSLLLNRASPLCLVPIS